MDRKHVKISSLADADPIQEASLYQKRIKIFPKEVHGKFRNWKNIGVVLLLGLYYFIPWIRWNGTQIILFDLPNRQFHILGWTFWPQDFFLLTLFLILATLALFLFTTLAGRVWCGYACPQTVWTDIFFWIERKIEGDRGQQIKLDKQPWNAKKIRIKASKHGLWLLFSLFTGFTFVGYFTPILELWDHTTQLTMSAWETFWVFFYSLATYGNAGFLREQVCIYMCPYARFQSVMLDSDTYNVAYNDTRGEPRGSRRRDADYKEQGLGDCIDCGLCVQVCPTGIDIRDGLQYQCIGCAACIDVCDQIMEKMSYPKGLISYASENQLHGGKTKILRPRIFVYAALITIFLGVLSYIIGTRTPLDLDVLRDRNSLFRETEEGWIENVYTIKIINMDQVKHEYTVTVTGIEGMQIVELENAISVNSGEVYSMPVRVKADPGMTKKSISDIEFRVQSKDDEKLFSTEAARFITR